MRDYSDGRGRTAVVYRENMDRRWFDTLSPQDQALFVPIDVYVHEGARRLGASAVCRWYEDVNEIQNDPSLHRKAAAELVRWARSKSFDPRDLDVYWYSLGAGDVREDGTPTPER